MVVTRLITKPEKEAMQKRLKELNYYWDVIDGRWGHNSTTAMINWQLDNGYELIDGIPTYEQMVALGATVPEVIPVPRSSRPAGRPPRLLPLLGSALVDFLFNLLPKVNLPMNPVLLALGRVNKATIAAIVSFVATITLLFGINISPDTQGILITLGTAIVGGLITWLVPNAPPAPMVAAALLQQSIASSTPDEYLEYSNSLWPSESRASGLTGDDFAYATTDAVPAEAPADGTVAKPSV